MSLSIKHVSVSSFNLNDDCEFTFKEHPQDINGFINGFIDNLHNSLSGKPGKIFLGYEEDNDMQAMITSVAKHEETLQSIEPKLSAQIKEQFENYQLTNNGVIVTAQYEYLATEFLIFAVVDNAKLYTLDTNEKITEQAFLDSGKCILLSRIELTELAMSQPSRNVATLFIRGASRKYKDFFMDVFGCAEVANTKTNTNKLVNAVLEYTESPELDVDEDERQHIREVVFDHCNDSAKSGSPLSINDLNEAVSPNTNNFAEFYSEQFPDAETEIEVNSSVAKQLVTYKGQGGGVSITFDAKHLGERIQYDAVTDTLTIVGTPPNLRDQLKRRINPNLHSIEGDEPAAMEQSQ